MFDHDRSRDNHHHHPNNRVRHTDNQREEPKHNQEISSISIRKKTPFVPLDTFPRKILHAIDVQSNKYYAKMQQNNTIMDYPFPRERNNF